MFSRTLLPSLLPCLVAISGSSFADSIEVGQVRGFTPGIHGAVELVFQSEVGKFYQIQISADTATWDNEGYSVKGTGGQVSVLARTRNLPKAFYRLRDDGSAENVAPVAPAVTAESIDAAGGALNDLSNVDPATARNALGVAPSDVESVLKATPKFLKHLQSYAGQSASPQIRIVTLGDSWGLSNEDQLSAVFGWGGRIVSANRCTVGSPGDLASMLRNDPNVAPLGNYMQVANGQSLYVGRNGDDMSAGNTAGTLAGQIRVIYRTEPGAGTLNVSTDTNANGVWTQRGTINADAAAGWAEFTLDNLTPDYYRVRVTGTSAGKSVKVVAMGVHERDTTGFGNGRSPGVVRFHIDGDGSFPENWNTPTQGYWDAAFKTFTPHLVFIRGDDSVASFSSSLPSIVSKIRAASPNTEIVLLGSHPTNSGPDRAPTDTYLRNFAAANGCAFIDIRRYLPTFSVMNAAGMMQDGIHMNSYGNRLATAIITDHFPTMSDGRTMAGSRDFLSSAGRPIIDQYFGGLRGSMSFADSSRNDIYLSGQNLDGSSATFPGRGRIGFLKTGNPNYRIDHAVSIEQGPVGSSLATFKDDLWAGIKFGRDMRGNPPTLDGGWFELLPFVSNTPTMVLYSPSGQSTGVFQHWKNATKNFKGTQTTDLTHFGELNVAGGVRIGTGVGGSGTGPQWISGSTAPAVITTMTIASPCVVTRTGHGLAEGTPIIFTTTIKLPTGITPGATYYVRNPSTDTFTLSSTLYGSLVNTSGSQSGKHTSNPGGSNGSLYSRTDGTGPNLYVRQNGVWVAK